MNQKTVLTIGALAVGVTVVAYFFGKKIIAGIGGIFSGNNALTANTPYADTGIVGTLGAGTNKVLGGVPQAVGESVGSGLFSIFGPSDTTPSVYYTVTFPDGSRHAIGDTTVDSAGNFTYQGVKYRLGDDGSGNKLATALTTIYGSGAS